MRRGLRVCRREGGRCRDVSSTEGRKGSIRMSVCGIRERRRARAEGVLRERAMEVLCRVRRSGVGGLRVWGGVGGVVVEVEGVDGGGGWECGVGRSMRRTVAP